MSRSNLWLMDGTFKTAPLITSQLYVIHYDMNGHVLPGVFALMTAKTQESYTLLFEVLQEGLPAARRAGPAQFSTDFELASVTAFKIVYTNTTEGFCFFHFSQSLWRKVQESGAAAAYLREEENELRAHFHAIIALAFQALYQQAALPSPPLPKPCPIFPSLGPVGSPTMTGAISQQSSSFASQQQPQPFKPCTNEQPCHPPILLQVFPQSAAPPVRLPSWWTAWSSAHQPSPLMSGPRASIPTT